MKFSDNPHADSALKFAVVLAIFILILDSTIWAR